MNQIRGIHENYFIRWSLLNALICYSNALKVLMRSDMPLLNSKKDIAISPIQIEELLAYCQHTKLASLCRINYQSHSIDILVIYDHHWKSSITFQKYFFSYRCRFIETSIFAPKPEVCEIDGTFRFQNGLNKLSRIWTNRLKSGMAHKNDFTCYF